MKFQIRKNIQSHSAAKAGISNSFKEKSFTKRCLPARDLIKAGVSGRNL